jgi:putative SOS response-associated peptidase YedK
MRGRLVPHWAKDLKIGARMINAGAETLATMSAFRDAFKSHRCLISASGFYEWQKIGTTKQPYAIAPEGGPLLAFAGLCENWRDKNAGAGVEWVWTCTVITGEPNELVAPIAAPLLHRPAAAWFPAKHRGRDPHSPRSPCPPCRAKREMRAQPRHDYRRPSRNPSKGQWHRLF